MRDREPAGKCGSMRVCVSKVGEKFRRNADDSDFSDRRRFREPRTARSPQKRGGPLINANFDELRGGDTPCMISVHQRFSFFRSPAVRPAIRCLSAPSAVPPCGLCIPRGRAARQETGRNGGRVYSTNFSVAHTIDARSTARIERVLIQPMDGRLVRASPHSHG